MGLTLATEACKMRGSWWGPTSATKSDVHDYVDNQERAAPMPDPYFHLDAFPSCPT
jgi:hypothetical protein